MSPGENTTPILVSRLGCFGGRFPAGALVLTTGAESTHAFTGRYVALGPSPVTPRVLAHEFGHLLGFDDAYVRSYQGDPRDAHGVVVIEWSGLFDDLMGAPGSGRVGARMIDTLITNYRDHQLPARRRGAVTPPRKRR